MMRNIIVDTDIGPDCDDVGALALLFEAQKRGEANLLSITNCTSNRWGSDCISYMCSWYGAQVPIGEYKKSGFLDDESCKKYNEALGRRYIDQFGGSSYDDAVTVMRKALAGAEDASVTLLAIGPLNNIAMLLQSGADQISTCTGAELIEKKCCDAVFMAGIFSPEAAAGNIPEYNIVCDVAAADYVMKHMPLPITYCGFEVGDKVMTGFSRSALPEEHPVRISYDLYTGVDGVRQSFDPITALYAVYPHYAGLGKCENLGIYMSADGFVRFDKSGKDSYLVLQEPEEQLAKTVETMMCGGEL